MLEAILDIDFWNIVINTSANWIFAPVSSPENWASQKFTFHPISEGK